jgi:hypothetical protein
VDYDVQPVSWNADVLKRFSDAFDERCLLFLGSSLPHLNDYYWHDITSGSFLNVWGLIIFRLKRKRSQAQRVLKYATIRDNEPGPD